MPASRPSAGSRRANRRGGPWPQRRLARRDRRKAYFGAWRETPVYSLETLDPGHTIDGPAIVEAETTTAVINSGDKLTVNDLGWLDIEVRL